MEYKSPEQTPYHPESDGITERFNSTLLNMLRALDNKAKQDSKSHIQPLVHAYNCTPHTSTKYSPYYSMFGRHPHLPIDTLIKEDHTEQEITEFAGKLRGQLRDAYNMASAVNDKARQNQKRLCDRNTRGIMPQIGDLVLVRQLGLKGKHKLADKWEDDIYQILDKDTNLPFYKVKKENGNGRIRTLHRNHLLPITWPILRYEMKKTPLRRSAHA